MIAAIDAGPSCRAAAARFGIASLAAVKRHRRWRDAGSAASQAQGGDTRSGRIEALGPAIPAMVDKTPGITLVEIAEHLEREHDAPLARSTVHRFFRRHGGSFKKRPPMQASRTARTSPRRASPGSRRSRIRIPNA